MTAVLLIALGLSLAANLRLLRQGKKRLINEVNGVTLPAIDDPDWKGVSKTYNWKYDRFDYSGNSKTFHEQRNIPGLELGTVRIQCPNYQELVPSSCRLFPILVGGIPISPISDDNKEVMRYMDAVWKAYLSRRVLEDVSNSPLLGAAGGGKPSA